MAFPPTNLPPLESKPGKACPNIQLTHFLESLLLYTLVITIIDNGALMKKTIILSVCLCLAVASFASGQSATSLEDLLHWFPDGLYSSIFHFDKVRYLNTCPGELREAYLDKCLKAIPVDSSNLPASFSAHYNSVTSVGIGKMSLKRCFEINADGEIIPVNRKIAIRFDLNGRPYGSWMWGHTVYVYRFDDLEPLVKAAVDNGQIVELESRFTGRPAYSYEVHDHRKKLYCFPTITSELLVAENPEHLEAMITAGLAGNLPIMQQLDLRDLKDAISIDTYLWKYDTDLSLYKATLEYVHLKDPNSSSIDEIEDHMEHMRQCSILTMHWDISGNCSRRVYQFGAEKDARDYFNEISNATSLAARLHRQTEFINGQEFSFRPTLSRIYEIRMETRAGFKRILENDRIIETCVDNNRTLLKLMEFASRGDTRR